jgi:hypothetical protein
VRGARWLGGRGPRAPREVIDAALVRGEKLLAAARATDGTWLLATREHLYAVGAASGSDAVRLRWEEVQRADWDRDSATLRVEAVRDYGERVATTAYQIEEPGALVALVRERVDASIVLQRRIPVTGTRGFTVVARRSPSGAGDLTWSFEFDPGIDPDDAVVATAADRALEEAKESLGR